MPFDVVVEAAALRDVLKGGRAGLHRLETRIEAIPAAVLVVDDAGHYIGGNTRAFELTGYTRDELLTKSIPDVTNADDLAAQERLWRSFERLQRQSGRYRIVRKNGSELEVDYDAFRDLAPGIHVSFLRVVRQER